jgi:hypothetical protein
VLLGLGANTPTHPFRWPWKSLPLRQQSQLLDLPYQLPRSCIFGTSIISQHSSGHRTLAPILRPIRHWLLIPNNHIPLCIISISRSISRWRTRLIGIKVNVNITCSLTLSLSLGLGLLGGSIAGVGGVVPCGSFAVESPCPSWSACLIMRGLWSSQGWSSTIELCFRRVGILQVANETLGLGLGLTGLGVKAKKPLERQSTRGDTFYNVSLR